MYLSPDVWDLDLVGGAPVDGVDWTAASAPGDPPYTGAAEVRTPSAPHAGLLAAGIFLLFVFGTSYAATPRG